THGYGTGIAGRTESGPEKSGGDHGRAGADRGRRGKRKDAGADPPGRLSAFGEGGPPLEHPGDHLHQQSGPGDERADHRPRGAGRGRTRVVTHRVAYLLSEPGVHPWNMLAITLTNTAAGEMKERITARVGPEAEEIWISTFHAMCVRILRRDGERIGYSRNFT